MAKYCKKYFFPERRTSCPHNKLSKFDGRCGYENYCIFQLDANKTEHAILDNLRIIKQQNAEILRQLTGKQM